MYKYVLNGSISKESFEEPRSAMHEAEAVFMQTRCTDDVTLEVVQVVATGSTKVIHWNTLEPIEPLVDEQYENRYGKPWLDEENRQLLYMCKNRKSIHNMASRLGRTQNAVAIQIRRMSYYHPAVYNDNV